MTRMIPKEKLGKKARREMDNRQRRSWAFCPATRKVESKKIYSRKRQYRDHQNDWNSGAFFLGQGGNV